MKRIGVLAGETSWHFRDLARAAAGKAELQSLSFSKLQATIGGKGKSVFSDDTNLADLSAVVVRAMPAGSLEQIIFRMDALGQAEGIGVPIYNPPRSLETAIDKYLTLARIRTVGIDTPRTIVCQHRDAAVQAFHELGGDVVVKPLFGGEGKGITRINDEGVAERTFQLLAGLGAVLYVQEFLPHQGYDVRLMVIGDRIFGMRRIGDSDWRTNLSRGARCEILQPTPEQTELAITCSQAVGAPIVGVDLLPTQNGREVILEVNAVPGWRGLASLGVDIAGEVLDFVLQNRRWP